MRVFVLALLLSLGLSVLSASAENPRPLPGQIVIDPEHLQWLMRHGGKHVFICGPGDPEDFLYVGKRNPDGTRDGDQAQRIEKLIEHGGNCIYMQVVRTHGGDSKDDPTHNPFIDSDPAKGLDEDILNQWETWFALMDRHEILIYLLLYDDGARIWNTGDVVGPEEKAFIQSIVNRFKHHKNLIWIVGEESEERYSTSRVRAIAETIRAADNHGHVIGNHHLSGTTFKAWQPGGPLNHFSMQLTRADEAAHAGAIEAIQKAAGRYQVIYSESTAQRTDVEGMRRHAWSVAMAGVMPMLLRADIASTPAETLQQCRHLQRFFEATEFWTMTSHDELAQGGTKYVLANPGQSYIAYTDKPADRLGIKDVPAGRYMLTWLDCVTGVTVAGELKTDSAGNPTFSKPPSIGAECALSVRRAGESSGLAKTPPQKSKSASPPTSQPAPAANRAAVTTDKQVTVRTGQEVEIQLSFDDADGPGPYTYTIVRPPAHGALTGDNNDRTYKPRPGYTGDDEFVWKVNDGRADSQPAKVIIKVLAAEPGPGVPARGTAPKSPSR